MQLGAFSISLAIKNLLVPKQFYEDLGFSVFVGSLEKNYLIMKNGNALVGLFQGMFPTNILTFDPGWDENAKSLESFDDVRAIQAHLKKRGAKLTSETDENGKGPASIMLTDPAGNVILVDQHEYGLHLLFHFTIRRVNVDRIRVDRCALFGTAKCHQERWLQIRPL